MPPVNGTDTMPATSAAMSALPPRGTMAWAMTPGSTHGIAPWRDLIGR
ncbi:hypothetical protein C7474_1006 [Microbacterium telephonicum]|uniref:Uncharacterized protein n=1 Tax=Microbacterium telephonicum TaxID=1714841 RepID=A0A498CAZ5_9MICO|nr:hypothetical protein C7474_1006 [Microbacterium telephonicum]